LSELTGGSILRTEAEMFGLILGFARADEHIRAVVLNGSRVNPNIPKDIFQDYDVIFFVDDLSPYINNLAVVQYFGETIIYQLPDQMGKVDEKDPNRYAYLMQFSDGNRIDLSFCLLVDMEKIIAEDSLTRVLLDKDDRIGDLPTPNDSTYLPKPATEKQFDHCCNEFWWLMLYAAKGLWRKEFIGPKYYQGLICQELLKMLTWNYGVHTGFARSPGKMGRFFEPVYTEIYGYDFWGMIKELFLDEKSGNIWDSLYTMGEIFRQTAQDFACHFGYTYPIQDDIRVSEYLRLVQSLPQDASSFNP
jgi:aminoglycoside 6-adenylyltransferase